jgi:hypothetical protein
VIVVGEGLVLSRLESTKYLNQRKQHTIISRLFKIEMVLKPLRTLLVLILCVAAAAATGAAAPDMDEALRCPVCDYTVSYLVRQLAKQQRVCQKPPPSSTSPEEEETWRLACDPSSRSILYDATLQRVVGVCGDDVLEAFPAIEAPIPPVPDPADTEAVEKRRSVMEMPSVKPLDKQFHSVLQRVCHQVLPRKHHTSISKALHAAVTHALGNYPPESDGAERRDVYGAVLKAQRQFCGKACGDDIKRPAKQEDKPAKAAFNAHGKRIRYHE